MRLSIITINLNNIDGLRKTLESVFSQTFTDYEYIIIDGNSTDGSKEIINRSRELFKKSPSYWISEPDNGIYNAMNKGISKACGEYLLFLNSGDCFFEKYSLTNAFNNNFQEDIAVFDAYYVNNDNITLRTYPNEITFQYLYNDSLCHQSTFIKRELFFKFGFYNESFKIIGDTDFFVRTLIVNMCSYKHVSMPLVKFFLDGISYTQRGREISRKERLISFQNYFPYRILLDYEELNKIKLDVPYRYSIRIEHAFFHKIIHFCLKVVCKIDSILK